MSSYQAPLEDLLFLYRDVFNMDTFWTSIGNPGEADLNLATAIFEEMAKFSAQELSPLNQSGDREACHFSKGEVRSPKGFQKAYHLYCEGAWNALSGDPAFGGMGLPKSLTVAIEEMVQGSCMAFGLAPMATGSAAFAIKTHASELLQNIYLPKMYAGAWSGSMALTEAQAGSDLGLLKTKAVPKEDGSYSIKGTKIFITWGEHDMAENIVHLVLARLPNSPKGSKGISLFLVPKIIPNEKGELLEKNALSCGAIEHKMGLRASPTCVMNFDGARGWLLGKPNKGLQAMFTMMNSMRLLVGINGIGVAHASYMYALSYAKERVQGKNQNEPGVPQAIYYHPDVQRMLMTMRAYTEGGRALYLYIAQYLDVTRTESSPEQERAEKLVAFLTPLAKAFLTDTAFESVLLGQQILGGYGYVKDYPQEQFVRDLRVTQIYEGTNGIQGIDLLNRKTLATKGELLNLFLEDIEIFIARDTDKRIDGLVEQLGHAVNKVKDTSQYLLHEASNDPSLTAISRDYLHMCGHLALAYMWARLALAAIDQDTDHKSEKFRCAQFYFAYLLPQIDTFKQRIHIDKKMFMKLQ